MCPTLEPFGEISPTQVSWPGLILLSLASILWWLLPAIWEDGEEGRVGWQISGFPEGRKGKVVSLLMLVIFAPMYKYVNYLHRPYVCMWGGIERDGK